MSELSRQDQIAPEDPLNYAPRRLHKNPEQRSTLGSEPRAELDPKPTWLAVARARSLEPEVMPDPPEFERGEWWPMVGFVGRLVLAVGIAAVAAWFFVTMLMPQSNPGASFASTLENSVSALSRTRQNDDGSKLAEFKGLLATSAEANQGTAPRQSDQLLQQFLAWREKTTPNNPPQ